MKLVRVVLRLIGVSIVCLKFYVFLELSSALLALVHRARGRPPATGGWRTRVFRTWTRWIAAIIGMRIEVRGTPPRPPFYLVANHLSYVDVLLLGSLVPCVFVSKAEVAGWPMLGRICSSVDTVFINRESKRDIPRVIATIRRVMAGGRGVIVFPEGTSSRGAEVMPFRASLLEIAASAGIPVSYAAISYSTPPGAPPAHRAVCWWGGMRFDKHLFRLLSLPEFRASVVWGEEPIVERDRKVLADRLRAAVEAQFQPVI